MSFNIELIIIVILMYNYWIWEGPGVRSNAVITRLSLTTIILKCLECYIVHDQPQWSIPVSSLDAAVSLENCDIPFTASVQ